MMQINGLAVLIRFDGRTWLVLLKQKDHLTAVSPRTLPINWIIGNNSDVVNDPTRI
jgi:hypothetical protein